MTFFVLRGSRCCRVPGRTAGVDQRMDADENRWGGESWRGF